MPLTFHILDSLAQDITVTETEDTQEIEFPAAAAPDSDSDDEVRTRRRGVKGPKGPQALANRKMVIHLFGSTAEGKPVRVNVTGFQPFFYVRLPDGTQKTRALFESRFGAALIAAAAAADKAIVDVETTFVKRKLLFGYTGGADFPFARLAVESIAAFRTVKSIFLNKDCDPIFRLGSAEPLEVFEANLDPMLRFFHLRDIQPCGWVTVDDDADAADEDIFVDWETVSPCAKPPAAVAPFLIASWDIETYSENGEFTIPKRGYERAAKLLVAGASDALAAVEMLRGGLLYPDSPPRGMDPLRLRTGGVPDRRKLDAILGDQAFLDELDAALSGAATTTGVAREAKVKRIQELLGRRLARTFPLAGDPVIQIGVVLQRGAAKPEKHIFVVGTCAAVEGATVHAYGGEREMLKGFAAAIRRWNPDILLGYNVFGFDENYVWVRAVELGLAKETTTESGWTRTTCDPDFHAFSRLCDRNKEFALETKFLSSSALGDNTMYMWTTHGRLQVDLYHYIKRGYALPSYKLDDATQHFMSGKLVGVEAPAGAETWALITKATADATVGRAVVLLDETGDGVVEKLEIVAVEAGKVIVRAPDGDDRDDLALAAQTAVKWAIVKDDVSPQDIFRFHRTGPAERAKVAAYCIQDCVLVLDLYKKLDVFNNSMAMANACSVPVGYIFTRGQGIKIESLIFKECHYRGQAVKVLPSPSRGPDGGPAAGQEESYEGAIVLDPVPGFYFDSPIGVADFASLYPSTIISENISYDTLVWVKDFNLDGSFRGYSLGDESGERFAGLGVRWTDITFDIWGSDPADTRKHPAKIKTGLRVCRYAQFPGEEKGTLPQILAKLLATRKAKRKEGDKETDPFRKALLDAEQLAYNLTANSLYGQLGSATFKIRLQHLAASTTAYGRKQIMFAKAAIEKFYGPGAGDPRCEATMVYGDTDSLFVNFHVRDPATGEPLTGRAALEATMELTEEAGKFVSRCLAPPHDFEYDKVFSPFIIFSKKRYVGNKYEESPEHYSQTSMGIATKRRDYAPLVKVIYGGALRILLTDKDINAAITFVQDKMIELVEGKMSMNLLTMSKSLRAEYKMATPPAHKVLAERIAARDPGNAPASGDRIPFIYVMPPPGQQAAKLQGERVETPSWIRAKGLKPDYRFYLEHQLLNPVTQLFALVAERIPGVVPPKNGWAAASPGERESATTEAIFRPVFNLCDRIATRQYGAKMFGLAPVPAVAAEKPKMVASVGTGTTATATPNARPPPKQASISSYFIDKMVLKSLTKSASPPKEAAAVAPGAAATATAKPRTSKTSKKAGKVLEI